MSLTRVSGLVSVVISNYNYEPYLYECLEGVRNQTYTNWEIIFIDDLSTDRSIQQIETWLRDKRELFPNNNTVVILKLPRHIGMCGVMNIGLYMARGEYIAIQDSDDISHVERFEKQVHYLNNHPDIELLGTNYQAFKGNDLKNIVYTSNWLRYGSMIRTAYSNNKHCVSNPTIMLRSVLIDRVGGGYTREPRGDSAGDVVFISRCQHPERDNMENLSDVLLYYRLHPNQISKSHHNLL